MNSRKFRVFICFRYAFLPFFKFQRINSVLRDLKKDHGPVGSYILFRLIRNITIKDVCKQHKSENRKFAIFRLYKRHFSRRQLLCLMLFYTQRLSLFLKLNTGKKSFSCYIWRRRNLWTATGLFSVLFDVPLLCSLPLPLKVCNFIRALWHAPPKLLKCTNITRIADHRENKTTRNEFLRNCAISYLTTFFYATMRDTQS